MYFLNKIFKWVKLDLYNLFNFEPSQQSQTQLTTHVTGAFDSNFDLLGLPVSYLVKVGGSTASGTPASLEKK